MPKYRYTAINPENKQLTGTIGAQDEKAAREELNQLGFSIVSINQISDSEAETLSESDKQISKFEFSAIDKNFKRIIGTIQAEDRYSAYKRLIKEYLFDVEYLVDTNLPEEEKQKQKNKGIYDLQNQLDDEEIEIKQKEDDESFDFAEFTEKQKILQDQVEFVLKKVKEILDLYESEMRPDTKEKIRHFVDKILRIKNSTNLDYIRKTCEELLTFLQQEEIFLYEEEKRKEHAKLALEAKSLMSQLNRKKNINSINFLERLKYWREKHIFENEQASLGELIVNFFISIFIGFGRENPEIKKTKEELSTLNEQIKQYIFLYFQASNKDLKLEANDALRRLFQERKKLKSSLKAIKKKLKLEFKSRPGNTALENFFLEINTFTGWLLTFYIIFYFLSLYINTKNFGTPLPQTISFYNTNFLKYFLIVLFLFHNSLSIKINFFRRNEIASLIITPIFFLATFIILINL